MLAFLAACSRGQTVPLSDGAAELLPGAALGEIRGRQPIPFDLSDQSWFALLRIGLSPQGCRSMVLCRLHEGGTSQECQAASVERCFAEYTMYIGE
jgi:hypothetical protein